MTIEQLDTGISLMNQIMVLKQKKASIEDKKSKIELDDSALEEVAADLRLDVSDFKTKYIAFLDGILSTLTTDLATKEGEFSEL